MGLTPLALTLALLLGPRPGVVRYHTLESGFPSACPRALALTESDLWVGIGATGSPEGLARVTRASLATGPIVFERFRNIGAEGLPDVVHALLVDGADVLVATDHGLYRWQAAKRAFVPLLEGVATRMLARADTVAWAVVANADGFTAAPLAELATRDRRPGCREPLLLAPRSATSARLVCEDRILELGEHGGFAVELIGTPLWREPMKDEGGRPSVYIHAAVESGGDIFILSQRGGLVRWRGERFDKVADDGRERRLKGEREHQELLPMRDFWGLAAEPDGGVLVSDALGLVHRWSGEALVQIWPLVPTLGFQFDPAAQRTSLVAAERDAVYFTLEPEAAHALVRLDRGPQLRTSTLWPLRRPGTSFIDPGVLDAIGDGQGGLYVSTNDGLWHFLP